MNKIKALRWFLIVLMGLFIIHFLTTIYLTIFTPKFMDFSSDIYDYLIFGYYTQFIPVVFSVITFVGLLFTYLALKKTIDSGFFNIKSSQHFKVAGNFFLASGLLSLAFDFMGLIYSGSSSMFSQLGQDLLLIIIGFSLFIISDYIKSGNTIQQENDLTI